MDKAKQPNIDFEAKSPRKIAIVGLGSAGASAVDLLSKELNHEDVKLFKVNHYNSLKIDQKNQPDPIDKTKKNNRYRIDVFYIQEVIS